MNAFVDRGISIIASNPVMMTVEEAIAIQDEQLKHYEQQSPGITERVKAITLTHMFVPGQLYSVTEINRYIPRGGVIEWIMQGRR